MNLNLTQIGFQDGSHIEVIDIENIKIRKIDIW